MDTKVFDGFVDKIASSIENNLDDYKHFVQLQQECLELLDQFHDKQTFTVDNLRRLSYFRLKLRQLFISRFSEKKIDK